MLRVVIISPGDVSAERKAAAKIITDHGDSSEPLEIFRWERDIAPGFGPAPIQLFVIDPKARIEESDIVVAIFGRRIGTPISADGLPGTQHEFTAALKSYEAKGLPHIMTYFKTGKLDSDDPAELEQFAALLRFREKFPRNGIYGTYDDLTDFREKFTSHFDIAKKEVLQKRQQLFTKEKLLAFVQDFSAEDYRQLGVPHSATLYSSFCPDKRDKPFLRLQIPTTTGYIPNPRKNAAEKYSPHPNIIHLIRDPVRPFEIQIGELRALRHDIDPKEVPFEGVPGQSELDRLYPLIQGPENQWLRIVLAELVNDPDALRKMHTHEKEESIKKLIARNPSAPDDVKWPHCLFCSPQFYERRKLDKEGTTVIIANDFPFGPFFHYIVFPIEPIHAWENITVEHLFEMNWLAFSFLKNSQDQMSGAAGIRMGFNSSIRHLVLGHKTRASAGASIAHVHKQVWGMAPGSVNLAEHLRSICHAYAREGHDYLSEYLEALRKAGLVIWEDEYVALFVPFGQIALHELQVMIKRRGVRTPLKLKEDEVRSLSTAEYIVTRLYERMDINSFNELVLSLPSGKDTDDTFRLICTFITREVDLAVSELSLLYVVDQHPYHTRLKIDEVWPSRQIPELQNKRLATGA